MKKYEEAKLEMITFEAEDVITTSGEEVCSAGPTYIDFGTEEL